MYVTKSNINNAVSNLKTNLDQVSDAIAVSLYLILVINLNVHFYLLFLFVGSFNQAAKKHLTQRLENVDGKLDEQVEMAKLVQNEVHLLGKNIAQMD